MSLLSRLRTLTGSDTGKAAELGIAAMFANVVSLVFTLVFTRVLGQSGYGSLGALISTFLLLTVAGYALQTTVAREVSAALESGDPDAGRGVRRWLRKLTLLAVAAAILGVPVRPPLAAVIGVEDVPWAASATLLCGALWLILSVERGALLGFQGYRTSRAARCSASSATGSSAGASSRSRSRGSCSASSWRSRAWT